VDSTENLANAKRDALIRAGLVTTPAHLIHIPGYGFLKSVDDIVPRRQADPSEDGILIGDARMAARRTFDAAVRDALNARVTAFEAAFEAAFAQREMSLDAASTADDVNAARKAALAAYWAALDAAKATVDAAFTVAVEAANAVHNAAIDAAVIEGIAAAGLEKRRQERELAAAKRITPRVFPQW